LDQRLVRIVNVTRDEEGQAPSPQLTLLASGDETPIEEDLLVLLHEIERRLPRSWPVTIQLMGPRGGEGTSTVVEALARCCCQRLGMNVLLLRLSQEPRPLDGPRSSKISLELEDLDYLDSYVTELPREEGRYRELTLGSRAAAALRNSKRERERLVETLNPLSDVTWIDAPPALTANDGLLMAPVVHGTVLVVEAEGTREPVGAAAVARIRQSGAPLLGVLFNKRRYYIPDVLYRML
jgi:hypothetical protein